MDLVAAELGLDPVEVRRKNFPGKDDFKGQAFHTARWPEGVDYSGKRVAVIGSGCTGYQLFPELAKETKQLSLFQIEPSWVFDVPNYLEPFPDQPPR